MFQILGPPNSYLEYKLHRPNWHRFNLGHKKPGSLLVFASFLWRVNKKREMKFIHLPILSFDLFTVYNCMIYKIIQILFDHDRMIAHPLLIWGIPFFV